MKKWQFVLSAVGFVFAVMWVLVSYPFKRGKSDL